MKEVEMEWLNIHSSILDSPEMIGSEPVDRATWLMLMRYCAGQENGGRIASCRDWGDRKWQQVCRVTLQEIARISELWHWEEDCLVVHGYPKEKESIVVAKREAGRKGGTKMSDAKRGAITANLESARASNPKHNPKQESKDIPKHNPKQESKDIPKHNPKQESKDIPKHNPKQESKDIPKQIPKQIDPESKADSKANDEIIQSGIQSKTPFFPNGREGKEKGKRRELLSDNQELIGEKPLGPPPEPPSESSTRGDRTDSFRRVGLVIPPITMTDDEVAEAERKRAEILASRRKI